MYVQRHGESEANKQRVYSCVKLDAPLIESGRKHIESLLPYYAKLDLKAVITSHSRRAIQTAEIIANHLAIPITVDKALHEVDMGELEGKSQDDEDNIQLFTSILNNWLKGDGTKKFPGGESFADVTERIDHVMNNYSKQKEILIVSHATFVACMMGQQLDYDETVFEIFLPRGGRGKYEDGKWELIDKRQID